MLKELRVELNMTTTQNGALAYRSTYSHCLDLFAVIGSLRASEPEQIEKLFFNAYCESADDAMKILFYARDIRGGVGERKVFRMILRELSFLHPESVIKNLKYIAEFGRFDDLLVLFDTPCEADMVELISVQLNEDITHMQEHMQVSLLAKWMPSVNCSDENQKLKARKFCKCLHMSYREYRKTLSALRSYLNIVETHLCNRDYDFPYEQVPSKALLRYRKAFSRNDTERYTQFLIDVANGKKKIHTEALFPYEIVRECMHKLDTAERKSLDTIWNSLTDVVADENKNAIVVMDGSGSMYSEHYHSVMPITIAVSLAIYFAQRNEGVFKDHFITFSEKPRLVKILGNDIYEKVNYCMQFNEVANTNLEKTFRMILSTAIKNQLPQSKIPETIYVISDMEFDICSDHSSTLYEKLRQVYEMNYYTLPNIVFWNVDSKKRQYPITMDDTGAVLISGSSPNMYKLCLKQNATPLGFMRSVLESERYRCIMA